ncbi:uncharacterized protein N7482_005221 [Penicillium canariense]|uniref:Uncharacterized protein n=1 Tax=Penicillium canariense TaxID=189055 RepID=A0A9W9I1Z7_9EURO|nr:uncharacterized protein N7482_005221 [Penicillium canariense]KAJ5166440.1 hypothetical protein N7482_005221 [Penicillium canariense]
MTTTTDFGPLTSIFSAPTGCATEQWVARQASSTWLRWGAGCNGKRVGYDSNCFPPGWSAGNSTTVLNKAFNPGYACPSGYTTHANATGTAATKQYGEYIGSIGTDSLAILCCPTHYDWNGEYCSGNQYQIATRSYLTVENSKCTTTSAPAYNGVNGLNGTMGGAYLQGTPIFLIQKVGATYDLPTSTAGSSSNAASGGLSTGAKIAIGICVPVGVLLIAAIAFIWWHRRKKAQKAQPAALSAQTPGPYAEPLNGKPELDAGGAVKPYVKQELDASHEIHPGKPAVPAELPAVQTPQTPVAEMATSVNKSPDTPQAELPGDGVMGDAVPSRIKAEATDPSGGEE